MAKQEPLRLNDADIAYVLSVLRNATAPMTTAELVEALKARTDRQAS